MSKKKQFFAQNNKLDAFNHRAKHFWSMEEAEEWLRTEGGGTIAKRNADVVYVLGDPIRVWGVVKNV
jgi:hypothetical protein